MAPQLDAPWPCKGPPSYIYVFSLQPSDAQGISPTENLQGGGGDHPPPLDFCLPVRIFWKYFYLYCMTLKIKVKHFCMTFHISGCKHDTKLILVSILTFSRSRISQMLKTIPWPWRLILELKVTHIHCMTFINSGCIHDADLTLVSILTFSRSRISENPKSVTWPWCLILKI